MVEKKDIEKLIIQNKKSTLKNHWNDVFIFNTTKYSGEIKPNELLIWRSVHFLRGAYPIFHLTFDQNGELNGIKTKNNPFYKLLNNISIGFFLLLALVLLITSEFKTAFIGIIGISVIGTLLHLVMSKAKKYETKILTDELKEAIENIERINNPELINKPKTELKKENIKEWTFMKILTRLLLYPFCLFILIFSITAFLPGAIFKSKTLGVFGIIVSLAYPFTDLIILFRKNKNHS
ncbi:hypothetical protein DFQ09_108102 [Winogradskyella pacifica]|uniref:Uncharacterized protein n=1 Tax=Winogradskyella pacifica TaxID=664642 RepID=A0A3D9LNJ2_9FLAO|nr:hypothetical protein [Winogradskyella pacifica]REE08226.1 hypothetical protein DFQ09_108102 [Winogradskyella pacifica]